MKRATYPEGTYMTQAIHSHTMQFLLPISSLLTRIGLAILLVGATCLAVIAQTTYNYTGAMQTYVVPAGVTQVKIEAWGGQGADGATGGQATLGGTGGLGGYAEGTLNVVPGQVLNIFVGGQGSGPAGGYNGGGAGGGMSAGGGGGASDVRVGGILSTDRVIVAGGGGGGGRAGCETVTAGVGGNGGSGGGGVGVAGGNSLTPSGVGPGFAGGGSPGNLGSIQGAFGPEGIGCAGFLGSPGSAAVGPNGGAGGGGQACCCFSFASIPGGGGGGGGFLGGGGGGGGSAGTTGCSGNDKGAGGGGGGGSSYTGGVSAGIVNAGIRAGDGQIVITNLVAVNNCGCSVNYPSGQPVVIELQLNSPSVVLQKGDIRTNYVLALGDCAGNTNAQYHFFTSQPADGAPYPSNPQDALNRTFDCADTGGPQTLWLVVEDLDDLGSDSEYNASCDALVQLTINVVDQTVPVLNVSGNGSPTNGMSLSLNTGSDYTVDKTQPGNVTSVASVTGDCLALLNWNHPAFEDNCPDSVKITFSNGMNAPAALPVDVILTGAAITANSGAPTLAYFGVGDTEVTYTFIDGSGNSSSITFTVTVQDNENPAITCLVGPVTLFTGTSNLLLDVSDDENNDCAYTISGGPFLVPTATDNCGPLVYTWTITSASLLPGFPLSGSTDLDGVVLPSNGSPAGETYTVTWTATDPSGNTDVCAYDINVVDNENPLLICPANIAVGTSNGGTGDCEADEIAALQLNFVGHNNVALLPLTAGQVYDNCDNDLQLDYEVTGATSVGLTTTNILSGNTANPLFTQSFALGVSTVTYTVTDNIGKTATCSLTVTVTDDEDPSAPICNADIVVNTTATDCSQQVTFNQATGITDNCTVSSVTTTAVDAQGNNVALVATAQAGCQQVTNFTGSFAPASWTAVPGGGSITHTSSNLNVQGAPAGGLSFVAYGPMPYDGFVSFSYAVNTPYFPALDAAGIVVLNANTATPSLQSFNPGLGGFGTYSTFVSAGSFVFIGVTSNGFGAEQDLDVYNFTFSCAATGYTGLFPQGVNTITTVVTDGAGNTSSCDFTITVNDNVAPTITCPGTNQILNSLCNTTPIPDLRSLAIVTDNCPASLSITQTPAAGTTLASAFPGSLPFTNGEVVGPITLTVSDGTNSANCTFNLQLQNSLLPVPQIGLAGGFLNAVDEVACGGSYTMPLPSATENCGQDIIYATYTPASDITNGYVTIDNVAHTVTFNSVRNYNISWVYQGSVGNTNQLQTVTIQADNQGPVFTTQNPVLVLSASNPGTVSATPLQFIASESDNCGIANREVARDDNNDNLPDGGWQSSVTFNCADAGKNIKVLVRLTDTYGPPAGAGPNYTVQTAFASIVDNTAPSIVCVASQVFNTNGANDAISGDCAYTMPSSGAFSISLNATATDNCTVSSITYVLTGATTGSGSSLAGVTFNKGITTVTWTATDASNLTSSCSFTVTVNDATAPTITCAPSITRGLLADATPTNCTYTLTSNILNATGSDNCANPVITHNYGPAPSNSTLNGATFPLGTTNITWTITDGAGLTATCVTSITVVDDVKPFAFCQPFTGALSNAGTLTVFDWQLDNGSYDVGNCNPIVDFKLQLGNGPLVDFLDFDCSHVGVNTVKLYAYDAAGNFNSCTTTVTIQDNVAPIADCKPTLTVQLNNSGTASILASQLNNASSDNCALPANAFSASQTTFNCSDIAGSPLPVLLTVTDVNGNTATCATLITVQDQIAPTAICQNFTLPLGTGIGGGTTLSPASINNGSTDNCTSAGSLGLALSKTSFNCSNLGANTVTLTVTDQYGNTSTCTSTVTVVDQTAPTAVCKNVSVSLNAAGTGTLNASAFNNGSTDNNNCAPLTYTVGGSSTLNLDCSDFGTQTIQLTVTDAAGNTSTCTANLTVNPFKAVSFTAGNASGGSGTTQNVDITVDGFLAVRSFQFKAVIANASVAQITGVTSNIGVVTYNASNGKVSWTSPNIPNGTTIGDGSVAFSFQVLLTGIATESTTISLTQDAGIPFEVTQGCDLIPVVTSGALVSPGTITITGNPPVTISGILQREGTPVAMADVLMSGSQSGSQTTLPTGTYNFTVPFGSNVTLTPQKNINVKNGVTSLDAAIILSEVTNPGNVITGPNQAYRRIAADVNQSNSITALDGSIILSLIVDNILTYPNSTPSWRFVPSNHVFANPANPFEAPIPNAYTMSNVITNQVVNFEGIKVGDVNASGNPLSFNGNETGSRTANPLQLMLKDRSVNAGESFDLEFTAREYRSIFAGQFGLAFNASELEFIGSSSNTLKNIAVGITEAAQGKLALAWADGNGLTVANGEVLIKLSFRAKAAINKLSEVLVLDDSKVDARAFRNLIDSDPLEIIWQGTTGTTPGVAETFRLDQNRPNPYHEVTTISFALPKAGAATLTLYDMTGKVVYQVKMDGKEGYNEVQLNRSDLPATGVYMYVLEQDHLSAIRRMILAD